MISDDEVEYENDGAGLLSGINNEQTRKLHGDMEKFVFSQSDAEGPEGNSGEELEMRERTVLSPCAQISSSSYFSRIPKRFIVLFLMSCGYFNMYCVRMCLNVAIVAMTRRTEAENNINKTTTHSTEPQFDWNKEFQGTILASLYWGYTATQIPAGLLSFKFGGTFLLGFAVFASSVLTLATPFIVLHSVYAFIVLRVLEGLFLGMVGASGCTIVSKWAPVYERSIFQTFAMAGLLFGTVIANSLTGVLAASVWGWPSVFYFFGFLGIFWYFIWLYFVYEEPSDHPNITKAELKLIGKHWNSEISLRHIPWRHILTSFPVWALIIINFTDCWSFYTFMISFPSYLKDVLKFDVEKVGFASSLPYLICCFIVPIWGYIIDILRKKKYISTIFARKFSCFIGSGVGSLFIIGIAHTTTSSVAMVMVTLAISINSFGSGGAGVNVVEIAPKYAGVLMGITNFACNITGFICPQVIGVLTVHGVPRHQWAEVFYITGGIGVFGMLIYCCFASAEKQAWAEH